MKRIALILAVLTFVSPVWAATATLPNGSISIVYVNAEGVVTYSPYATISNATASQFVTWCQAKYTPPLAATVTAQQCFNFWANDWIRQTINSMAQSAQTAAAAAASAATPIPAIVPAQ